MSLFNSKYKKIEVGSINKNPVMVEVNAANLYNFAIFREFTKFFKHIVECQSANIDVYSQLSCLKNINEEFYERFMRGTTTEGPLTTEDVNVIISNLRDMINNKEYSTFSMYQYVNYVFSSIII